MPPKTRTIVGIDLSTDASQCARLTWVCELTLPPANSTVAERLGPKVTCCEPVAKLLPHTLRQPVDRLMLALRDLLFGLPAPVWIGVDASLGIPARLLPPGLSWFDWLSGAVKLGLSPEEFRVSLQMQSKGKELKRLTDIEARTPFSPYNLRHYRQCYHALRGLALPLAQDPRSTVWPQRAMAPLVDGLTLLEVCPASWLKRRGWYAPYKGRDPVFLVVKERWLSAIEAAYGLTWQNPADRSAVLVDSGGDGLDSLLSALSLLPYATGQVALPDLSDQQRLEGWVL